MRTAYREHLDAFAHDLILMCDIVQETMTQASRALLQHSLEAAEDALSLSDQLEETRVRCDTRAIELLALEAPVARDLRQVISSIYIVEDFDRMAALGMHVARCARRRHPGAVLPEPIVGYFEELARLVADMGARVRDLLVDPDPEVAVVLGQDDDAVDDLHDHLMSMLTLREWPHSTCAAVDITLLARYYERFADHCVNVAARIVYLTTGMMKEEYLAERERSKEEEDFQRRFEDLERIYHRGRSSSS
ncbi:phosphate signaling complex protein PhoU [Corynebacterium poyangense]|uniref:Phosphate signaling complex protein PhoU n=1 Tax=Corynebacterium poyangense TaxID=2684405 RepID=A0A7H0SQX2_9CORY|nr:phosphate signaling complex protein PhoU [Corynebacterium poyangense]MBZ8176364.1 phosphate signaling complex protein PhoU [Corynebacterium poyangense]QNQ90947.1 phosphate signaling complex protein PhoU [Corynebacterium poyangense]